MQTVWRPSASFNRVPRRARTVSQQYQEEIVRTLRWKWNKVDRFDIDQVEDYIDECGNYSVYFSGCRDAELLLTDLKLAKAVLFCSIQYGGEYACNEYMAGQNFEVLGSMGCDALSQAIFDGDVDLRGLGLTGLTELGQQSENDLVRGLATIFDDYRSSNSMSSCIENNSR